jgi:hypothetical protein
MLPLKVKISLFRGTGNVPHENILSIDETLIGDHPGYNVHFWHRKVHLVKIFFADAEQGTVFQCFQSLGRGQPGEKTLIAAGKMIFTKKKYGFFLLFGIKAVKPQNSFDDKI